MIVGWYEIALFNIELLYCDLNIIFLLTGNLLFSSSHHLHDHSHAHDHNNIIQECEDCIIIDNNNICH